MILFSPAAARAGGFELPDSGARGLGRGGAYAVGAADPTAMHYNPSLLAKQRGTTVMYHHTLYFHRSTFARSALDNPVWGDDQGTTFDKVGDRESLFPLGIYLAVATDFGLDNWTFGAGAWGPSGVGKHDYPDYGPQSFQLTEMDVLLAYYVVGAAWKLRDIFGIGATINYVDLLSLRYGLVADADPTSNLKPVPDSEGTQLITELDLKDRTAATASIGFWYRPIPALELGLSSRFVPGYLTAKGGVRVDKDTVNAQDLRAELDLTLPVIVRGGLRYVHMRGDRELFDIEANAVLETWSMLDTYDVKLSGTINGLEVQDLRLEKNWQNTWSARLGGDVNPLPWLTVRLGGFIESPTAPKNYSHLDFPSFLRGGISGGLTAGYRGIYLTAGYMHIFQETRTVSESKSKVFQQRPLAPCPEGCDGLSGVPANVGTFESSYDLFSLGLDIRFRELLRKRRNKHKAEVKPSNAPKPNDPTASHRRPGIRQG